MPGHTRESYHAEFFHPGQPIPVATRIGNLIVTGLIPSSEPQSRVFDPDPAAQIAQMFKNLETIVAAAGATLDDIIKITIYVKDRSIREFLNPIWIAYFPDEHSCPARSTMPVDDLAGGALIQCDALLVMS